MCVLFRMYLCRTYLISRCPNTLLGSFQLFFRTEACVYSPVLVCVCVILFSFSEWKMHCSFLCTLSVNLPAFIVTALRMWWYTVPSLHNTTIKKWIIMWINIYHQILYFLSAHHLCDLTFFYVPWPHNRQNNQFKFCFLFTIKKDKHSKWSIINFENILLR